MSKTLVYDDLSVDEVKTPHIVETLHIELMVMSGPHHPKVGFNSD